MMDLLKAVLILAVLAVVWKGAGRLKWTDDSQNPAVITNPVYLEMRINFENAGRTLESVALAQTVNDADCQKFSQNVLKLMDEDRSRGPNMKLKSIECKAELSARNAQLFDNEPSVLTYVSAARGNPFEREMRWILWGTSVDESEIVCGLVPQLQKIFRGKVSCIHALRS
jgi:hypothetical protein